MYQAPEVHHLHKAVKLIRERLFPIKETEAVPEQETEQETESEEQEPEGR